MELDVIKEYLAKIGFSVDEESFKSVNKKLDELGKNFKATSQEAEKQSQNISNATEKSVKSVTASVSEMAQKANQSRPTDDIKRITGKVTPPVTALTRTTQPNKGAQSSSQAGEGGFFYGLRNVLSPTNLALLTISGTLIKLSEVAYKFMSDEAKRDTDIRIQSRRNFTTESNQRSIDSVLKAMGGRDLKDIAIDPELRSQFMELRKLTSGMGVGREAEQGLKDIRRLNFEFSKFSITMDYFFANLAGHLGRFFQLGFLAKILSVTEKLFSSINKLVPKFGDFFDKTWDFLTKTQATTLLLSGLDKGLNAITGQGDKYGKQADVFKTIADASQGIWKFLQDIWRKMEWFFNNPVTKLAHKAANGVGDIAQKIQKTIENLVTPPADAGTLPNNVVQLPRGNGKGSLKRWSRNHDPYSPEISDFIQKLIPTLSSDYLVTAGKSTKGHTAHGNGRAFDVSLSEKSDAQAAALIQSVLGLGGKANLEVKNAARFSRIQKMLQAQGVDTSKITHSKNGFFTGDHLHVGTPVTINIHGARDARETAREVDRVLKEQASKRIRENRPRVG